MASGMSYPDTCCSVAPAVRVACSPESNSHMGSSGGAPCRVRTASGSLCPQVPVALYQEASRCPLHRWVGIPSTLTTPLRSIVRSARRPRGNRRRPGGECMGHSGRDTCTRRPLADYPVVFPFVPTSGPTQRWQLADRRTERSAAAADAAHSRGELNERPSARETTRVGQSRIVEKAVFTPPPSCPARIRPRLRGRGRPAIAAGPVVPHRGQTPPGAPKSAGPPPGRPRRPSGALPSAERRPFQPAALRPPPAPPLRVRSSAAPPGRPPHDPLPSPAPARRRRETP